MKVFAPVQASRNDLATLNTQYQEETVLKLAIDRADGKSGLQNPFPWEEGEKRSLEEFFHFYEQISGRNVGSGGALEFALVFGNQTEEVIRRGDGEATW